MAESNVILLPESDFAQWHNGLQNIVQSSLASYILIHKFIIHRPRKLESLDDARIRSLDTVALHRSHRNARIVFVAAFDKLQFGALHVVKIPALICYHVAQRDVPGVF